MPATSTKAKKETAPKKTAKVSKATAKKDVSISDKLDSLFNLQKIDSEIDRIRIIRGELPLEVEDLENEIIGLETRTGKIQDEIDELQLDITNRKNSSKEADAAILKYKDRQNNVRNNREFESLSKEFSNKKEVINEELGQVIELKPLVQLEATPKRGFEVAFEKFLAEGGTLDPILNDDMKTNTKEKEEKVKKVKKAKLK